jgi:hypothetical protein
MVLAKYHLPNITPKRHYLMAKFFQKIFTDWGTYSVLSGLIHIRMVSSVVRRA